MKFVQPIRDPVKLNEIKEYLKEQNPKNYILFLIGISTGYRISDILRLKVKDVKETHITIRQKKTGKVKMVLICKSLRRELDLYISNMSDADYLFPSRNRNGRKPSPITRNIAYKIIRNAAAEFGLKDVGTHSMRKTFGFKIYLKMKDIALLMDHFNHDEEKVTLRYIGLFQETQDDALEDFEL
ncbi:tyrosine-type recombinase/integrase [Paenibacillus sp. NPDC056722]|uniref:tyrosine-type recombinase/integrase n=1 Tax=Paenibacillus sp. NPDC056722 TaxID=3345924 RepID=UPI0036B5C694